MSARTVVAAFPGLFLALLLAVLALGGDWWIVIAFLVLLLGAIELLERRGHDAEVPPDLVPNGVRLACVAVTVPAFLYALALPMPGEENEMVVTGVTAAAFLACGIYSAIAIVRLKIPPVSSSETGP